jgi:hypothetical protein
MAAESQSLRCELCGESLDAPSRPCPHCGATPQWRDYLRATAFAEARFAAWLHHGLIAPAHLEKFAKYLAGLRESAKLSVQQGAPFRLDTGLPPAVDCWRCGRAVRDCSSFCNTCGAPLGQEADTLRYLAYVAKLISAAAELELPAAQANACQADVQAQIASLRIELERGRLGPEDASDEARATVVGQTPYVAPTNISPPPLPPRDAGGAATPAPPRRSFMQILLDPRSIQWLLASGGVLLVVGLVIWLASLGIFRNELVVAGCMGGATLAVLAGGYSVVKYTRHQLAGNALTLLACLVMPLNLWFYQAHHLVTLDGHLWAAALVCCVLYAAAAVVLEDPVFVYVLCGGVAMTGLLILGDLHKLYQIASPAALLVVLGLITLHAERAFAESDGPFLRKRFGMACFWSAQALIGTGLLLLLGAQIAGWTPAATVWFGEKSSIVTDHSQRLLAIALVLAGTYAFIYSDLVVRRVGVYVYLAAFTLLWAEFLAIDLAQLWTHPPVLIGVLAATSLAVNLAYWIAIPKEIAAKSSPLLRPLPALGISVALVPVVLGFLLHLRATRVDVYNAWPYSITWAYVASMAATAVCCQISSLLHQRRKPQLAGIYIVAAATVTLIGAAGLLTMLGVKTWPVQLCVLMALPLLYLLASRLYHERPAQQPLIAVAHGGTLVLLLSALFAALHFVEFVQPVTGLNASVMLALLFGEAALFYAAAAILYRGGFNVYLATAMICAAQWQLLNYWNFSTEYFCMTYAALGLALLAGNRLVFAQSELAIASSRSANALMSLSSVAAALLALSHLLLDSTDWTLAILMAIFAVMAIVSAGLARPSEFRRWYIAVSIVQAALTVAVLQRQIHLSFWQHIEFFCVALGLILLTFGYALWYREQNRPSDGASFCLLFGSLLAGLPLAIAALVNRFGFGDISMHDEIALATVSILMLVSGFMCRLRATTLVGGSLLALHLAMLIVFAGMRAQLALGVYLAIGGAALFALGLLLSIYRDRLMTLPRRIKEHEGVFGVLAWR